METKDRFRELAPLRGGFEPGPSTGSNLGIKRERGTGSRKDSVMGT